MEEKKSLLEKWGFIQKIEDFSEQSSSVQTEQNKADEKADVKTGYVSLSDSISRVKVEKNDKKEYMRGGSSMDRFVGVQDLYTDKKLPLSGKNTVYTIDALLKALPEALPSDLVRATLQNIAQASYLDLNELINDGENRIDVLNEYIGEFSQHTESVVAQYKSEIAQLKDKIAEYETKIEERVALQSKQDRAVQYEIERISAIISSAK